MFLDIHQRSFGTRQSKQRMPHLLQVNQKSSMVGFLCSMFITCKCVFSLITNLGSPHGLHLLLELLEMKNGLVSINYVPAKVDYLCTAKSMAAL